MVPGHTTAVSAVAFCAEGGGIVTAADGTLRFWNLAAAARERTVWRHGENVYGFAFSPDGARAASSAWGGEIKLWDAATGREIRSWTAHKTSGVGLAWSGDGRHLISGGNDGGVRAWDPASGKQAREFEDIDNGRANHIALSPDGRMFLAPSSTGTAKVWELESGRLVHTLAGHKSEVYDVAWSSDARLLATAGTDGVAKLWDARTGTEFATLKGHSGAVYGIAFHPDGKALATASQNRTIRLWDAASGREVAVLRGHEDCEAVGHAHRRAAAFDSLRRSGVERGVQPRRQPHRGAARRWHHPHPRLRSCFAAAVAAGRKECGTTPGCSCHVRTRERRVHTRARHTSEGGLEACENVAGGICMLGRQMARHPQQYDVPRGTAMVAGEGGADDGDVPAHRR